MNVKRHCQDPDERGAILDTHTYNPTRTRGCNRYWDGNWFHYVDTWDFSFFSTELLKHYEALKLHVFEQLANLNLVSISGIRQDYIHEYYAFEITNMPSESSKIYQLALKHMNEDNPQLPKNIESLLKRLKDHNDSVDKLKKEIDMLIKQKLTTDGIKKYDYDYDNLYRLLSLIWQPHLPNEALQKRIDHFVNDPKSAYRDEHNQYFYFNGKPLGHGSDDEFKQMKTELFSIVSDGGLVTKIVNIESSETDLRKRIDEIKILIDPIIQLIDQGLYETKIKKCCPTFWSLVKKYR